jgi:hypothetical protein
MNDQFFLSATISRSPHQARAALRDAIPALSARGLLAASKWAAELLVSVRRPTESDLGMGDHHVDCKPSPEVKLFSG